MRDLLYRPLALIFVVIFTVSFFIGLYVFSDSGDSSDGFDDLESANRNASIPPWAMKWAEGLQNVDADERMRRLAEVRKAARNKWDVQASWENRLKDLAYELIQSLVRYENPEDFIREYICGDPLLEMRYHIVLGLVTDEHVPLLCDMLNDETYSANWHKIAQTISWVSKDPAAAEVLWGYFRRDDTDYFSSRNSLPSKLYALAFIGNTEVETYYEQLRLAAGSEVEAKKLAGNWIDDPQVMEHSPWGSETKDFSLRKIRSGALKGLIFSGRPENIDYVRQLYQEELQICKDQNNKSRMLSQFIDAMACIDYIEENGKDQLLLEMSLGFPMHFIPDYVRRYSWAPKGP